MKKIFKQIDEYLDYCQNVRFMTDQTMRSRTYGLYRFARIAKLSEIEELDNTLLNNYIKKRLASGLVSAHSINIEIARVLSMVRYFQDMGIHVPLKIPLVQKLKIGEVRRVFFKREQIEKVLEQCDEFEWLLIRIAFDSGLRLSELTNLRISNFYGQRIKFIGKGRKVRESFITEETLERLTAYIQKYSLTDYLWVWGSENQFVFTVNTIRKRMKDAFSRCGFDDFYPHALRHSFGTDIQRRGASLLEMQKMLGHSSAQTTEKYIHALDGHLQDIFEKYR